MARLTKPLLLDRVILAVSELRWNCLVLDTEHPQLLRVFRDRKRYDLRIYIWNISHGGGAARATDEFRIQITNVGTIQLNHNETTLLLGWDEDRQVFVGFDSVIHSGPQSHSPSLQVKEGTMNVANRGLYGTQTKTNNEIVIAFRPAFFMEYVENHAEIHGLGLRPEDLEIMDQIGADASAVSDEAVVERVSLERQIVIREVLAYARDASFRERVLTAYRFSCAFCGIQLRLVDAAHIVPVADDAGSDDTSNGVALCTLHHRAFDNGLVSFNTEFETQISDRRLKQLSAENRTEGSGAFRTALKPIISLPPDIRDRPDRDFILRGRSIRGWN